MLLRILRLSVCLPVRGSDIGLEIVSGGQCADFRPFQLRVRLLILQVGPLIFFGSYRISELLLVVNPPQTPPVGALHNAHTHDTADINAIFDESTSHTFTYTLFLEFQRADNGSIQLARRNICAGG
jgi:hypothetical protein